MLQGRTIFELAQARYRESLILLENNKPDGAVYLCGYALELILKYRIVKTLDWDGYPDTEEEFRPYRSFRIHGLDTLLHLSGLEKKIRSDNTIYARWQIASTWNSEIRYKALGRVSTLEAKRIIQATRDVILYMLKLTK